MSGTRGQLTLATVGKRFDDQVAVAGLDLDIGAGEFFSLLGASGCGKTTTLRMIAGFERPDTGAILLDGTDLVHVPPHQRPVNTVFQSYALFPFLSVRDNVAFGLRYQHVTKADTARRVGRALELVQMGGLAARRPHQLSGGQQQRVALARALVLEPTVLLLDEPMGALDAKLRKQLQIELRALQQAVGTTFVYVTHDQEEALTMSDRLAVLRDGRLMQVGTPSEVYSRPSNAYVAGFLGTANLYEARVTQVAGGTARCSVGDVELIAEAGSVAVPGAAVSIAVRPERVQLRPLGEPCTTMGDNDLKGCVEQLVFRGAQTQVRVRLPGLVVLSDVPNVHREVPEWLAEGREVAVQISRQAMQLLSGDDDLSEVAS